MSLLRILDFVLCIVFEEEEECNTSETASVFFLTSQGREASVN